MVRILAEKMQSWELGIWSDHASQRFSDTRLCEKMEFFFRENVPLCAVQSKKVVPNQDAWSLGMDLARISRRSTRRSKIFNIIIKSVNGPDFFQVL